MEKSSIMRISKVKVMNLESAIRGMRNPKKSWHKSDSKWVPLEDSEFYDSIARPDYPSNGNAYKIGEEDLDLALKLVKAGSDHRKFMRQIFVSLNIEAPAYWWRQFDTYKVGTVANSTSQMHTITKTTLTKENFVDVDERVLIKLNSLIQLYNKAKKTESKNKIKKEIINHMPASFLYLRTVTLNYEVLANIYSSRKNHFLDEWKIFCKSFIENLPYAELIIEKENLTESYTEMYKDYYKKE